MIDPFKIVRPLLFKMDAERAHDLTLKCLSLNPYLAKIWKPWWQNDERFSIQCSLFKKSLKFPIGIAAGLDKNAVAMPFFSRIGLGSLEVGTVTPKAQPGNPKPRLWRYPEKESLRNAFGFNNQGHGAMARRIVKFRESGDWKNLLLGVNLGKNKDTPDENSFHDYVLGIQTFSPLVDYLVINISSPNTPGLRNLQKLDALKNLLQSLGPCRKDFPSPIFLKIAPDLDRSEVLQICELVKIFKLSGLIATNTTHIPEWGQGGVSGLALTIKAKIVRGWCLEFLRETPEIQVWGVGGISHYEDLKEFWIQGGLYTQIYSAFIFRGPGIFHKFAQNIKMDMDSKGIKNLTELISSYRKTSI